MRLCLKAVAALEGIETPLYMRSPKPLESLKAVAALEGIETQSKTTGVSTCSARLKAVAALEGIETDARADLLARHGFVSKQ